MVAHEGLGLGLAEVAMDTSSLFDRLTGEVPVSGGSATLPDAPGAGFERLSVYPEVFGRLLH